VEKVPGIHESLEFPVYLASARAADNAAS